MCIINKVHYNEHTSPLFKKTKIIKLDDLYQYNVANYMFKYNTGVLPTSLNRMFKTNKSFHQYNTRNRNNPCIPLSKYSISSKSLRHKGPQIWNRIPVNLRSIKSARSFKCKLKQNMLSKY